MQPLSPQAERELTPHERRMQGGDTYEHQRRLASGEYVPPMVSLPEFDLELDNNPDMFASLPMPTADFEEDIFGGANPFAGARLDTSMDRAIENFDMRLMAAIEAASGSGTGTRPNNARVIDRPDYTNLGTTPVERPAANWPRETHLEGFGNIPTYSGDLPSPFPLLRSTPRAGEWQINWDLPTAAEIQATVRAAAAYHGIPPEPSAAILANENGANATEFQKFGQVGERVVQSETDAYERFFPEGTFGKYGNASTGIANMKPQTLRAAAAYIEMELGYPPVPDDVMPDILDGTRFERVPGRDWQNDLYYQAAHIRELVDRVSGVPNYSGPIDRDMVLDIGRHYNGGATWNMRGPDVAFKATKYGYDVIRHLDNAASGVAPLYFYGPNTQPGGGGR